MAAILAAAIGALAVGTFVILNEAGVFAAPALYPPAGGVTGRMTFATAVWLIAWVVLHAAWKRRQVNAGGVFALSLLLLLLGVLLCFPPVWQLVA